MRRLHLQGFCGRNVKILAFIISKKRLKVSIFNGFNFIQQALNNKHSIRSI